jgi:hypothetical protein
MKKIFAILAAAFAVLLTNGCAGPDPIIFSEVFQLQKDQEIRTACNLWYTDPVNVDCRNIQQGSFIPLGTVVTPVSADNTERKITFKALNKTFTIDFKSSIRLCTMRDFISETFTTKTVEEMLKGIPANARQRIVRGEVVPGMTRQQVLLAYGLPPAARTPDLKNETWIYWVSDTKTIRLVFRGDTVRQILETAE